MNDNYEVYDDDISLCIDEYMQSREIEDKRKMTSSMWAACMMYTHDRLFKNDSILRIPGTRNNQYDLDAVAGLLERYIYLCSDHNQRVCTEHFCLLSGISRQTISYWANDKRRNRDHIKARAIHTRLVEASLMAADDLMLSRSGVNSIAYRNAMQERYNRMEDRETMAIDTADLRHRLGIAEQMALPDNQQEPEPKQAELKPWESVEYDYI